MKKTTPKNSVDEKRKKLEVMASRGGTVNERTIAKKKLETLPAVIESEESRDIWVPMGNLIRVRGNVRVFLRGPALKHFLHNVKEGEKFSNRTVPLTAEFGTGDFYVVLSWMLKNNLCTKYGSKYEIGSKARIAKMWNASVDEMKI